MTDDRSEFAENRTAGLRVRHETREARAIRRAVAEEIALALEEYLPYYSEEFFPADGTSTDCIAAKAMRHAYPNAARIAREIGSEDLQGDGPCSNCGTEDNPVWFTESVFWNAVVRTEPRLTDDAEILCIPCFIIMADQRGYRCNWRLLPEWHWETKDEAVARQIGAEETPS